MKQLKSSCLIAILFFVSIQGMATKNDSIKKPKLKIGGALRFNVSTKHFESTPKPSDTFFTLDTWLINVKTKLKGIDLNFEYRFYPTFGTQFLHHGWFGYQLNKKMYLKLGVSQVPFGISRFASHSWWFQLPYYVGLEDDYDMGLKLDYNINNKLILNLAYYRQAEPEGPIHGGTVTYGNAGPGRYSYDLTTGRIFSNDKSMNTPNSIDTINYESIRELNTINARLRYKLSDKIELGLSSQIGQNYNDYNNKSSISYAECIHIVVDVNNFNFKGEYIYYNYAAKGVMVAETKNSEAKTISKKTLSTYNLETIQMGAYGFNYQVATKSIMYVAGLSYKYNINGKFVDYVEPYFDFAITDKLNKNFENTYHVIPGVCIKTGKIYTFADFALGKNQPWLTNDFGVGLDQGRMYTDQGDPNNYYYTQDPEKINKPVPIKNIPWNYRFNINIGYVF